jgi:HD domain-containing protein
VNDEAATLGTAIWVQQTQGRLSPAERRSLLTPLARTHVRNAVGRFRMFVRLHPGRHASLSPDRLIAPDTVLTSAARRVAEQTLPLTLLNHSYRTYRFGLALGELEGIDVDTELLFAAALLHDTGLVADPPSDADFTLASSRLARDVAEEVGLSTAATEVMQTAITMHYSPGVAPTAGPEAYLLSAGAAVDVVGLRSWDLPADMLDDAVRDYPRDQFKTYFSDAFRREAARVPQGRAQFLNRYGAFSAAIRFAPFAE